MGSHDLKVGFEYLLDIAKYTIDGRSGPIQYRDLNGQRRPRFASSTSATTATSATTGAAPTIATSATPATCRIAGIRTTGRRSPPACAGITSARTTSTASAIRSSRTCCRRRRHRWPGSRCSRRRNVPRSRDLHAQLASLRVSASATTSAARATPCSRDSTAATTTTSPTRSATLNPGGANYKTFRFLDQNGNSRYDGPSELGALSSARRAARRRRSNPNMKKPYADEFDGSIERQFWGESSVRVAYVRKNTQNEFRTINVAREGQFHRPDDASPSTIRDFVNGVTTPAELHADGHPDRGCRRRRT